MRRRERRSVRQNRANSSKQTCVTHRHKETGRQPFLSDIEPLDHDEQVSTHTRCAEMTTPSEPTPLNRMRCLNRPCLKAISRSGSTQQRKRSFELHHGRRQRRAPTAVQSRQHRVQRPMCAPSEGRGPQPKLSHNRSASKTQFCPWLAVDSLQVAQICLEAPTHWGTRKRLRPCFTEILLSPHGQLVRCRNHGNRLKARPSSSSKKRRAVQRGGYDHERKLPKW